MRFVKDESELRKDRVSFPGRPRQSRVYLTSLVIKLSFALSAAFFPFDSTIVERRAVILSRRSSTPDAIYRNDSHEEIPRVCERCFTPPTNKFDSCRYVLDNVITSVIDILFFLDTIARTEKAIIEMRLSV